MRRVVAPRGGVHPHVGADVRGPGDVVGFHALVIHAEVVVRDVEHPRAWGPGRRLPVLHAGRRGTHARCEAVARLHLGVERRASRREVDARRPRHRPVGVRGDQLTGRAIDHVEEAVALRAQHHLAQAAADLEVHEHALVDAVEVVHVVRRGLIRPLRHAVVGIAREERGRPLVVAGTERRIPHAGIPGAVVEEVELRVVRDPSPHRPAAELPLLAGPGGDAEIAAAIRRVVRLELRPDPHVGIGPGAVGAPGDLATGRVERGEPATHAHLTAAVADEHLSLHHERGHGDRLAPVDVAELRAPHLATGLRVHGDRVHVERVEVDPAVGIGGAAIDDVAAGDPLRRARRRRLVLPLQPARRRREVDRVEDVGVRRHDVHRAADDERRRLVAAQHARREAPRLAQVPDVGRGDLGEAAEPRGRVILRRHHPLSVVRHRTRCHDGGGVSRNPGLPAVAARGEQEREQQRRRRPPAWRRRARRTRSVAPAPAGACHTIGHAGHVYECGRATAWNPPRSQVACSACTAPGESAHKPVGPASVTPN